MDHLKLPPSYSKEVSININSVLVESLKEMTGEMLFVYTKSGTVRGERLGVVIDDHIWLRGCSVFLQIQTIIYFIQK
ncbi:DUF2642 domain-containing protein [Halobacillus amylolyticus]|uniref:DUF2642 domain-containing protein n=1 Tax=Halobacillus amylolyticus TaxID=2932259 RepID=A0ABY4HAV8_9BACI|nr:DUF2642 domain-containing protein [Halobacillus amylolyticus]UOR11834.1 DUF2642 domain-containing protein [Halobacillus amylolyticus]